MKSRYILFLRGRTFYVEDTLTGKPRGLGLGLALCKLVADAHGGRVWMHSEPGRGSTFFLALPVSGA